jgi:hypothetical protein
VTVAIECAPRVTPESLWTSAADAAPHEAKNSRRVIAVSAAVAWVAVTLAALETASFISTLARRDAIAVLMVVSCVAVSMRLVFTERAVPHAGVLLGAPILAVANAATYRSGLVDPLVVVALAVVIGRRYDRRQAIRCAVMFAAIVASTLAGTVALRGNGDLRAVGGAATSLSAGVPAPIYLVAFGGLAVMTIVAWWLDRPEAAATLLVAPRPQLDHTPMVATPAPWLVAAVAPRHPLRASYRRRTSRTGAVTRSAV